MTSCFVTHRGRVLHRVVAAGLTAGLVMLGGFAIPAMASASAEVEQTASSAATPEASEQPPGEEPPPGAGGTIAPGAAVVTPIDETVASGCTANFIYTSGDRVFIGYAAHCAAVLTDLEADADGCLQETLPLGTPVTVEGADNPATLVYSSWMAMQENGVGPGDLCQYNDFALAEIDPEDVDNVDPTVPLLGGPTTLAVDGVAVDDEAFSYQPNIMTPAVKQGRVAEILAGGLAYVVVTELESEFGDSGAGYLNAAGDAFGVLSAGDGGSVVTDLSMALSYAIDNSDLGEITLESGTEPFSTDGVEMTPMPAGAGLPDPRALVPGLPPLA